MKKYWLLLVATLVVLSLSACGSGDGSDSYNDDNNPHNGKGGNDDGSGSVSSSSVQSVPVDRFRVIQTGKHFWSSKPNEVNNLISNASATHKHEGEAFRAFNTPQPGTIPVHRFFNTLTKQHIWSADQEQVNSLFSVVSATWRYDGIAFHVYSAPQPNTLTLHHLVNADNDDQLFTTKQGEITFALVNFPGAWEFRSPALFAPIQ